MALVKIKDKINAQEIYEILDTYAHAVIITKTEDKQIRDAGFSRKLPEDEKIETRYQESGIEVINVRGKDLKNYEEDVHV